MQDVLLCEEKDLLIGSTTLREWYVNIIAHYRLGLAQGLDRRPLNFKSNLLIILRNTQALGYIDAKQYRTGETTESEIRSTWERLFPTSELPRRLGTAKGCVYLLSRMGD